MDVRHPLLVSLVGGLLWMGPACPGSDDGGFNDHDDDTTAGDDDDDTTAGDDDDDDDDTTTAGDDDDTTAGDDDNTTAGDDDDTTAGDDDDSAGDDDDDSAGDDDDSSPPLTVALVDTGSSGVVEIDNILTGAGHAVERMDYATVESSLGAGHDVLVYPGSGGGVWAVINNPGMGNTIRDFVAAGGGYVGICGGSIAGASDLVYDGVFLPGVMLGLLDVEATWYNDWSAYVGNMVELQFQVAMEHEILTGLAPGDSVAGDYAGGPSFESYTEDIPMLYDEDLDPGLAGYQVSGAGALAVGEYGVGKVVLSAVHPEYNHPDLLLSYLDWVRP